MMEAFPATELHELYGASEGARRRIGPAEWLEHPGSVGRPWPGVDIRILGEDGSPKGSGEDGVIYIRPPSSLHFSYRNDAAATERAWVDDAFTVGDIGHLSEDGYLTITDRVSDMVLWGGVNIAPREIEEALFEHPDVVDCAVFGIPDRARRRAPQGGGGGAGSRIERHAGRPRAGAVGRLQGAPRVGLHRRAARDPNGKVLKRLLRAEAASERGSGD